MVAYSKTNTIRKVKVGSAQISDFYDYRNLKCINI